jgi:glycosyltransferase involved in cell wall biosynthesis
MNLLFVNATKSWGGIKTWMLEIADFLKRRGHHVVFVCRERDLLIEECAKRSLKCYPIRFGTDFSPGTIWRFLKIFKAEQTEVVITNISKGVRTAGVAAKLKRIVHINRLGNYRDIKNTVKTRILYTLLVDRVFVPSRHLFDHFAQFGWLRKKLRWFYNAVTPPPFQMPHNRIVQFAIVAKLSKRKQVDKVLQAFRRIQDLPWELHIGGDGPELENLQKLVYELRLEPRVHFACEHDPDGFSKVDPYTFLKDKDVGILYSNREAFGISLIEYMALSCAVIASNIDGIPEIVEHGVDGLLVDPYNMNELEKAIRVLLTDSKKREELTQRGYEKVQRQFNQGTIFARVEDEILETLKTVKT